MGASELAFTVQ